MDESAQLPLSTVNLSNIVPLTPALSSNGALRKQDPSQTCIPYSLSAQSIVSNPENPILSINSCNNSINKQSILHSFETESVTYIGSPAALTDDLVETPKVTVPLAPSASISPRTDSLVEQQICPSSVPRGDPSLRNNAGIAFRARPEGNNNQNFTSLLKNMSSNSITVSNERRLDDSPNTVAEASHRGDLLAPKTLKAAAERNANITPPTLSELSVDILRGNGSKQVLATFSNGDVPSSSSDSSAQSDSQTLGNIELKSTPILIQSSKKGIFRICCRSSAVVAVDIPSERAKIGNVIVLKGDLKSRSLTQDTEEALSGHNPVVSQIPPDKTLSIKEPPKSESGQNSESHVINSIKDSVLFIIPSSVPLPLQKDSLCTSTDNGVSEQPLDKTNISISGSIISATDVYNLSVDESRNFDIPLNDHSVSSLSMGTSLQDQYPSKHLVPSRVNVNNRPQISNETIKTFPSIPEQNDTLRAKSHSIEAMQPNRRDVALDENFLSRNIESSELAGSHNCSFSSIPRDSDNKIVNLHSPVTPTGRLGRRVSRNSSDLAHTQPSIVSIRSLSDPSRPSSPRALRELKSLQSSSNNTSPRSQSTTNYQSLGGSTRKVLSPLKKRSSHPLSEHVYTPSDDHSEISLGSPHGTHDSPRIDGFSDPSSGYSMSARFMSKLDISGPFVSMDTITKGSSSTSLSQNGILITTDTRKMSHNRIDSKSTHIYTDLTSNSVILANDALNAPNVHVSTVDEDNCTSLPNAVSSPSKTVEVPNCNASFSQLSSPDLVHSGSITANQLVDTSEKSSAVVSALLNESFQEGNKLNVPLPDYLIESPDRPKASKREVAANVQENAEEPSHSSVMESLRRISAEIDAHVRSGTSNSTLTSFVVPAPVSAAGDVMLVASTNNSPTAGTNQGSSSGSTSILDSQGNPSDRESTSHSHPKYLTSDFMIFSPADGITIPNRSRHHSQDFGIDGRSFTSSTSERTNSRHTTSGGAISSNPVQSASSNSLGGNQGTAYSAFSSSPVMMGSRGSSSVNSKATSKNNSFIHSLAVSRASSSANSHQHIPAVGSGIKSSSISGGNALSSSIHNKLLNLSNIQSNASAVTSLSVGSSPNYGSSIPPIHPNQNSVHSPGASHPHPSPPVSPVENGGSSPIARSLEPSPALRAIASMSIAAAAAGATLTPEELHGIPPMMLSGHNVPYSSSSVPASGANSVNRFRASSIASSINQNLLSHGTGSRGTSVADTNFDSCAGSKANSRSSSVSELTGYNLEVDSKSVSRRSSEAAINSAPKSPVLGFIQSTTSYIKRKFGGNSKTKKHSSSKPRRKHSGSSANSSKSSFDLRKSGNSHTQLSSILYSDSSISSPLSISSTTSGPNSSMVRVINSTAEEHLQGSMNKPNGVTQSSSPPLAIPFNIVGVGSTSVDIDSAAQNICQYLPESLSNDTSSEDRKSYDPTKNDSNHRKYSGHSSLPSTEKPSIITNLKILSEDIRGTVADSLIHPNKDSGLLSDSSSSKKVVVESSKTGVSLTNSISENRNNVTTDSKCDTSLISRRGDSLQDSADGQCDNSRRKSVVSVGCTIPTDQSVQNSQEVEPKTVVCQSSSFEHPHVYPPGISDFDKSSQLSDSCLPPGSTVGIPPTNAPSLLCAPLQISKPVHEVPSVSHNNSSNSLTTINSFNELYDTYSLFTTIGNPQALLALKTYVSQTLPPWGSCHPLVLMALQKKRQNASLVRLLRSGFSANDKIDAALSEEASVFEDIEKFKYIYGVNNSYETCIISYQHSHQILSNGNNIVGTTSFAEGALVSTRTATHTTTKKRNVVRNMFNKLVGSNSNTPILSSLGSSSTVMASPDSETSSQLYKLKHDSTSNLISNGTVTSSPRAMGTMNSNSLVTKSSSTGNMVTTNDGSNKSHQSTSSSNGSFNHNPMNYTLSNKDLLTLESNSQSFSLNSPTSSVHNSFSAMSGLNGSSSSHNPPASRTPSIKIERMKGVRPFRHRKPRQHLILPVYTPGGAIIPQPYLDPVAPAGAKEYEQSVPADSFERKELADVNVGVGSPSTGKESVPPPLPSIIVNNVCRLNVSQGSGPLLGPQLSLDYGKPTLVLDLDETLVHSSFQPYTDPDLIIPTEINSEIVPIFVRLRPGCIPFLQELANYYEIVVFTASVSKYADPLLSILDPHNHIRARLFREACIADGGYFVKDLSKLGRDPRSTIIIDNSPVSFAYQPENAIRCATFIDDPNDRELFVLAEFLKSIRRLKDFRPVLKKFCSGLYTAPPPPDAFYSDSDGEGGGSAAYHSSFGVGRYFRNLLKLGDFSEFNFEKGHYPIIYGTTSSGNAATAGSVSDGRSRSGSAASATSLSSSPIVTPTASSISVSSSVTSTAANGGVFGILSTPKLAGRLPRANANTPPFFAGGSNNLVGSQNTNSNTNSRLPPTYSVRRGSVDEEDPSKMLQYISTLDGISAALPQLVSHFDDALFSHPRFSRRHFAHPPVEAFPDDRNEAAQTQNGAQRSKLMIDKYASLPTVPPVEIVRPYRPSGLNWTDLSVFTDDNGNVVLQFKQAEPEFGPPSESVGHNDSSHSLGANLSQLSVIYSVEHTASNHSSPTVSPSTETTPAHITFPTSSAPSNLSNFGAKGVGMGVGRMALGRLPNQPIPEADEENATEASGVSAPTSHAGSVAPPGVSYISNESDYEQELQSANNAGWNSLQNGFSGQAGEAPADDLEEVVHVLGISDVSDLSDEDSSPASHSHSNSLGASIGGSSSSMGGSSNTMNVNGNSFTSATTSNSAESDSTRRYTRASDSDFHLGVYPHPLSLSRQTHEVNRVPISPNSASSVNINDKDRFHIGKLTGVDSLRNVESDSTSLVSASSNSHIGLSHHSSTSIISNSGSNKSSSGIVTFSSVSTISANPTLTGPLSTASAPTGSSLTSTRSQSGSGSFLNNNSIGAISVSTTPTVTNTATATATETMVGVIPVHPSTITVLDDEALFVASNSNASKSTNTSFSVPNLDNAMLNATLSVPGSPPLQTNRSTSSISSSQNLLSKQPVRVSSLRSIPSPSSPAISIVIPSASFILAPGTPQPGSNSSSSPPFSSPNSASVITPSSAILSTPSPGLEAAEALPPRMPSLSKSGLRQVSHQSLSSVHSLQHQSMASFASFRSSTSSSSSQSFSSNSSYSLPGSFHRRHRHNAVANSVGGINDPTSTGASPGSSFLSSMNSFTLGNSLTNLSTALMNGGGTPVAANTTMNGFSSSFQNLTSSPLASASNSRKVLKAMASNSSIGSAGAAGSNGTTMSRSMSMSLLQQQPPPPILLDPERVSIFSPSTPTTQIPSPFTPLSVSPDTEAVNNNTSPLPISASAPFNTPSISRTAVGPQEAFMNSFTLNTNHNLLSGLSVVDETNGQDTQAVKAVITQGNSNDKKEDESVSCVESGDKKSKHGHSGNSLRHRYLSKLTRKEQLDREDDDYDEEVVPYNV